MPLMYFGDTDSPVSMKGGDKLFRGNSIVSTDKRLKLIMQTDGNLVLYFTDENISPTPTPLWSSSTSSGYYGTMQSDGNFVVYDTSNRPVWNSGTAGNTGSYLSLQSDGNMVIYASNKSPLWSSGTSVAPAAPVTATPVIPPVLTPVSTSSPVTTSIPIKTEGGGIPGWLLPVAGVGLVALFMLNRGK